MNYELPGSAEHLTFLQDVALYCLCERHDVPYDPYDYQQSSDLPDDWVAGWIGGAAVQATHPTVYVACAPTGEIRNLNRKDGDARAQG